MLREWASSHTRQEVWDGLRDLGYFGGPILSMSEVMEDPHIQARGFFSAVHHPVLGTFQQPGNCFMVNGSRTEAAPAPLLRQHNQEVFCGELGLGEKELAVLAAEKVI